MPSPSPSPGRDRPLSYASSDARLALPDAPTPTWLIIAMTLLAIAPLIAASQFAAHLRFDVVDDQMFGYFGWRIAHGGTVYLDVWDNKPPGIYWINALGFLLSGGDSYAGVVVLCVLALLVAHACFFFISASIYNLGAAAVATVLASFYLTHGYFQGGTNRTETFLIAFELAGVLCYFRGFARDRWWKWLLCGALCGCAFLFKQVGLAGWGALGLHMIVLMFTGQVRGVDGVRRGALMVIGAALSIGAAALALASQGALEAAWFAVVTFNQAYFGRGASSLTNTFLNRHMLTNHMFPALLLPALMCVAALIHAFLWWLRPQHRPQDIESRLAEFGPAVPRSTLLFVIWYVVALYGAVVSPHYFRHYLVPTLPPMLLVAGYLINVIKTEISLVRRLQQRAWVTGAFVLMGYLAWESVRWHIAEVSRVWVNRFERGQRAPWEIVGDEVRRLTTPDQALHCWGYYPGVYLHARRPSMCRFVTTEKIGQVGDFAEFQRRELHDKLSASPPPIFVVSAADYAWFTEPDPDKTRDWIGDWLGTWLPEHYVRVADLTVPDDNVYVYQRKDLAAGKRSP